MLTDGGPDENSRYGVIIKYASWSFFNLKLDALFIATQTPWRSAYNPVESRMAPLSLFLAWIFLPYETFKSHLNAQGITIRIVHNDLEKFNFKKANEILAGVWNEAVIDSFPVIAEWRDEIKTKKSSYPQQECMVK